MDTPAARPWSIWADTGGTFTDCIALDPAGATHTAKVLSSGAIRVVVEPTEEPTCLRLAPGAIDDAALFIGATMRSLEHPDIRTTIRSVNRAAGTLELESALGPLGAGGAAEIVTGEPAPVLCARLVTRTPFPTPLPPAHVRLATTRGTNALLQRAVEPVAFFVTRGFADLLRIGDQRRPDLFALDVHKPDPYHDAVVEVSERLDAVGAVLTPLSEEGVRRAAVDLRARGLRVAAIALLHSWINPAHERSVAAILHEAGFTHVSLSSQLAPRIRIVPRAETAVVNAALSTSITDFLDSVRAGFRDGGPAPLVMTSAGGLHRADRFHPKDSLLSGPAAGVVGAAAAGLRSGARRIIAFDMGGTSTDVSRYDATSDDSARPAGFEHTTFHHVGDARLLSPALAIESVAAGGGSTCGFRAGELFVGPQSAGANPGPACYGAGGPLTITDVNLLLGRLDVSRFQIPIDRAAAEHARDGVHAALLEHQRRTSPATPAPEPDAMLEGFLDIANERMADAIRRISTRKGYDPADAALLAFGGAGAQHACAIADRLGITRIIVPAGSSLLSAYGLGVAASERVVQRSVLRPLDEVRDRLDTMLTEMIDEATAALADDGVPTSEAEVRARILELRFVGQDHTIPVQWHGPDAIDEQFRGAVLDLFGHIPMGKAIEVESLRVTVGSRQGAGPPIDLREDRPHVVTTSPPDARSARFEGEWRSMRVVTRGALLGESSVAGPALITERRTATVVEPGWSGAIDDAGAIVLTRSSADDGPRRLARRGTPAGVRNELIANRLASIAEEMGELLQRTALSTNVKERLDFSCAILDGDARLAVSAPHLPVHLGALGICTRMLLGHVAMRPSDIVVTNHPAFGGSHLPDVTIVAPVYAEDSDAHPIAYVATRAHHAEIGGITPGSMPPGATSLGEEGVVIPPTYLARAAGPDDEALRRILTEAPYPTRALEDNLADVDAAVAALRRGIESIRGLAHSDSPGALRDAMAALRDRAELRTREALRRLDDQSAEITEILDDGSTIRVRITIADDWLTVDFTGTDPVRPNNLNAPLAVTTSATMYVLRLLVREDLPLNEGLLAPVELIVPSGSMLNPNFSTLPGAPNPAVAGGNVETSQRVTNALLRALRLSASSQGTMNNLLFGSHAGDGDGGRRFGYYETIAGGIGATATADGADATHSHMTNTAITDPEILEHRYPVRLERFAIRRGSGGRGLHRGGDGAIRELTFLAPLTLSMLTQHRTSGPEGLEGGDDGATGAQRLIRDDGSSRTLAPADTAEVGPGDRLIVETPGAGGYGAAPHTGPKG